MNLQKWFSYIKRGSTHVSSKRKPKTRITFHYALKTIKQRIPAFYSIIKGILLKLQMKNKNEKATTEIFRKHRYFAEHISNKHKLKENRETETTFQTFKPENSPQLYNSRF